MMINRVNVFGDPGMLKELLRSWSKLDVSNETLEQKVPQFL